MEQQILDQLKAQEEKLNQVYLSVEKTRKYIWWTVVITIAVIVLPLIFLPFAIQPLIKSYSTALSF